MVILKGRMAIMLDGVFDACHKILFCLIINFLIQTHNIQNIISFKPYFPCFAPINQ
ncbi:hypothetical protein Emtol_2759 [Emticicia oligotrophica DSM 17448]|uniref:Uncharacterized protein n=1 Tax=Emticicia oligotrophica (strain DSM 17448 / CIP 109782 / MTCC 6937 / GPTSA100-15) TaxID=929562 RepID=A0ABM5N3J6_EMTOG|nr:hypothetical protein Emtol_2759 [Emticicia oligotrophica DSM 17448]